MRWTANRILQLSTGYASQQKVKQKLPLFLTISCKFLRFIFTRSWYTNRCVFACWVCVYVCECVNVSVKSEWRNVLAFPLPSQGTEEGKRSRRGRMDEVASVSTNSLPAFGGAPWPIVWFNMTMCALLVAVVLHCVCVCMCVCVMFVFVYVERPG